MTMIASIIQTFGEMVWRAAWQSALMAGLVAALLTLCGRTIPARWRCVLWCAVLLRLLAPALPSSPWSLFHAIPTSRLTAKLPTSAAGTQMGSDSAPRPGVSPHGELGQSPLNGSPVAAPFPVAGWRQAADHDVISNAWIGVLAAMWALGVLLAALQAMRTAAGDRRRLAECREAPAATQRLLEECRVRLGIRRRVRLVAAPGDLGPAVAGIWLPTIVLPERLLAVCSREELELVVLHELAHVRRQDALIELLATAAQVIHWFNPVARLTLGRLRAERELACDEAVLERLESGRRREYGLMLLSIVEWASRRPSPVLVPFSLNARHLKRRIEMIHTYRASSRWAVVGSLVLLAVVAATCLTDAHLSKGESPAVEAPPASLASDPSVTGGVFTIRGQCTDEEDEPFAGAVIDLYSLGDELDPPKKVASATSDAAGRYVMEDVPHNGTEDDDMAYALVITARGRPSSLRRVNRTLARDLQRTQLNSKVGTLSGRVTDEQGRPVSGAWVFRPWVGSQPVPGIVSSRTDSDGRYAITDLAPWQESERQIPATPTRPARKVSGTRFTLLVQHPDYPLTLGWYTGVPQTLNVELKPGSTVQGRVVDKVTGRPAARTIVSAQGIHIMNGRLVTPEGGGWYQTRTDGEGRYTLRMMAGFYNIWAAEPERIPMALDTFEAKEGQTQEAPDISLVAGGFVTGRVVDAKTDQPLASDQQPTVAHHGPARPRSGAAVTSVRVGKDGRYLLRVAPGANYIYLMGHERDVTYSGNAPTPPNITVEDGQTIELNFHVGE